MKSDRRLERRRQIRQVKKRVLKDEGEKEEVEEERGRTTKTRYLEECAIFLVSSDRSARAKIPGFENAAELLILEGYWPCLLSVLDHRSCACRLPSTPP
jgi:vacuolar-type H+-ATPase subunit I/STV1